MISWAIKEYIEIGRTSVSPAVFDRNVSIREAGAFVPVKPHHSYDCAFVTPCCGSDTPIVSSDPSTRIDRRMLLKPAWAFYINLGTKLIKPVALSVRNI